MREHELLGEDVDLDLLAKQCKNFSGAEIEGLIKSATSFALYEGTDIGNIEPLTNMEEMKKQVKKRHFKKAQEEVNPQFGVDTTGFENAMRGGIISWGPEFDSLKETCNTLVHQVRNSPNTPLLSILLKGPKGFSKQIYSNQS